MTVSSHYPLKYVGRISLKDIAEAAQQLLWLSVKSL